MSSICTKLACVAVLATPALGAAQAAGSYQFANGTLDLAGAFSTDGCGTYLCLGLTAGAGGQGILLQVTRATTTAAYAPLGATYYTFVQFDEVGFLCAPVPQPAGCQPDGGGVALLGSSGNPYASITYGFAPYEFGTYNDYVLVVNAPVTFTAYDANNRVLAKETFAPSIVVTPEPAPLALALGGFAVLGAVAWRRQARGA